MKIEIGKEYIFNTGGSDSNHNRFSGEVVRVFRQLTETECDIDDVGIMYKVELRDGNIIDVFEDELLPMSKGTTEE